MRTISDTIARLTALRSWKQSDLSSTSPDKLTPLAIRGSNPGALTGFVYASSDLTPRAALVVVLHGCTQTAAAYDHGSGWSDLAEREGFALLFPQQRRSNNPNLCFNWFSPNDTRRGEGEALSIKQMIDQVVETYGIDKTRVFCTGLSAGGAMASTMLATYPETFAAGAIIAGLAHGIATTIPEAFDRMRGHALPSPVALQTSLRRASNHKGPWPAISVWQGTADLTVAPQNAQAIVDQWRDVHGLDRLQTETSTIDGALRRTWTDGNGSVSIEHYSVPGMGHGTPLHTGEHGIGIIGPFMLEAGISSTLHIADSWGLITSTPVGMCNQVARPRIADLEHAANEKQECQKTPQMSDQGSSAHNAIIDALRSAGLLK